MCDLLWSDPEGCYYFYFLSILNFKIQFSVESQLFCCYFWVYTLEGNIDFFASQICCWIETFQTWVTRIVHYKWTIRIQSKRLMFTELNVYFFSIWVSHVNLFSTIANSNIFLFFFCFMIVKNRFCFEFHSYRGL